MAGSSVVALNIGSPDMEAFYSGRHPRCVGMQRAGSLSELRGRLDEHSRSSEAPVTLDLIGHSTRNHHLLRLGDTPIDMLDPGVARFFRELAASGLPTKLKIVAVRLLGCATAVTDSGHRTLGMLAHTLRLPVFGTTKPLLRSHYNAAGFDPAFAHLLVGAPARRGSPHPSSPSDGDGAACSPLRR
jgi:hypothetical protein